MTGLLLAVAAYLVLRYVLGPISEQGHGKPTIGMTADFGFLRCLIGFTTGMLVYEFYKDRSGYLLFKNSWCFLLLFFGALTAMHFGITDILIVAFFPFILISAAYNETILKRVLNWRVFQRLGDWSFSIYMVHTPIMITLILLQLKKNPDLLALTKKVAQPNYAGSAIACVVVLIITLLLSAFTYRFVEIPARNYFNRLFNTRQKKITPGTLEV